MMLDVIGKQGRERLLGRQERKGLELVNRWSGRGLTKKWHLNKNLKEVYLKK